MSDEEYDDDFDEQVDGLEVEFLDIKDMFEKAEIMLNEIQEKERPTLKEMADIMEKVLDVQMAMVVQLRIMKESIKILDRRARVIGNPDALNELANKLGGIMESSKGNSSGSGQYI